jgi:C_GCAxxG_C_C family probable redox protein
MLKDLIEQGFGEEEDFNCAEKIFWGANIAYKLGFDKNNIKFASGFGGGMGIESKCGALTAAIMILGWLFVKERAHEGTKIKELAQELFKEYENKMGFIDCASLKAKYRTEELGCKNVIIKAAEVLDKIVEEEINI